ncbi:shematrin-like protein 1 [Drosophila bipectinata]|uniref:shematrin-like protein 1 n=1 Tax=Drosophila bipectinata TaxID=42026 RepID=UPI001C89F52F|nr:shematrin-like protein 1 [Drosophila bipectinata]
MLPPARLILFVLLISVANGQRSKSRQNRPQGRTLGLLTPLLLGGGGSLFDVPPPPPPVRPSGGSSSSAGTQSDPSDSYYGNNYGYRPNYGYGYGYPSYGYNYGYPNYGYYGYYRPSYNYGGYQRPQPNPGSYYGYRPNYGPYGLASVGGYPSNGGYGSAAAISSNPTSSLGVGVASGAGSGAVPGAGNSQLSTAQAAQLAGLLGQALGSSLRPLLANGGAAGATSAGANPQALSGLLGLLG